ncbi:phosphatase PAP2 family protein [Acinetobacter shaoyimingii]|uniref:undecaprenyl-diphosphate phosphatase n=1 Tax=Acinetobacter shaoyimingii TaxID=2715164 RepID=A0A6G8RU42_9GAMM|nr:phosphatase PAP2 family protein [Acinetobacter shaoyimingii]NHB58930.1 phosphatase PAP2 family protein [Acinetobacter shaoyimingii]QIO05308.1 phosphatase PAP2 family protein [Acinetobacter shaoyimingii]
MPYIWLFIGCLGLILSIFGLYIPNIQYFDTNTVVWMSQHRFDIFNEIAVFLSYIGGLPSMLFICGIWCLKHYQTKNYVNIIVICSGLLGSAAIGWILKFWFNRPRPELIYQMVETYGASFPSAHSIYAATFSCLIMLIYRQHVQVKLIMFFACLWFIVMGFSRVYLAAHFPSDVLAGWSIAFIWIAVLWLIFSQFVQGNNKLFLEKNLNEVE